MQFLLKQNYKKMEEGRGGGEGGRRGGENLETRYTIRSSITPMKIIRRMPLRGIE